LNVIEFIRDNVDRLRHYAFVYVNVRVTLNQSKPE